MKNITEKMPQREILIDCILSEQGLCAAYLNLANVTTQPKANSKIVSLISAVQKAQNDILSELIKRDMLVQFKAEDVSMNDLTEYFSQTKQS